MPTLLLLLAPLLPPLLSPPLLPARALRISVTCAPVRIDTPWSASTRCAASRLPCRSGEGC